MSNKIVSSTIKKCKVVFLFWIFLSIKFSQGVTKCGWIFRNNLINPKLSDFDASYILTAIPVVNAKQAWCIPVKNHSLTVDLGSVTNVTRLAVQGENGTEDYVTSYEVDHSEDGRVFTNIKNGLKPQCSAKEFFGAFPGMSTGSDIAESNLTISFRAQYVRFRPQESVGRLCTRIDIYGCQTDDGLRDWVPWSACTSTSRTPTGCSRSRTRTCENRREGCKGARNETETCRRSQCPGACGELGIIDDNRSINDTAFLASSYKPGFQPHRARLNGFNAWCASITNQFQYLEIDFGGETEVSEIKIQGLQSANRSAWVTKFFLDFRRSDGSGWRDYTENNSVKIYDGNTNGSMVRSYVLPDEPSARFIRFYPLEWTNDICMRVSVSGCRVPPFSAPIASGDSEDVDEAFWILLWILLGLLLLLLLLGLLYLCCRYCPCCACCGCCPCAKKAKKTDGTMMTELTSDEIDAGVQYATGATQTDGASALPETETQTVAIHFDGENGRAGAGAVYFSQRDGGTISGARYNEGMQTRDDQTRISTTSGLSSTRREEMMTSESRDRPDGARVAGMARDRSRERVEARTTSSQYQREEYQSFAAASGRGEYLGRYDVGVSHAGERVVGQTPLAPPPVIELEVTPNQTGSWRVETVDQVNERLAYEGRSRGASELQYQGVSYRGMHDRDRARSVDGLGTSDVRGSGVVVKLDASDGRGGLRTSDGMDSRETAEYTVHLRDCPPEALARLEATEVGSRNAHERYYNQDTYRARGRAGVEKPEPEVETWKVTSIRGQAFQGTINVDTSRGHVTGQPFHYQAPLSPTSSDVSSISQYNGSSISEQYDERNSSRKEKYYKMFEYSRD